MILRYRSNKFHLLNEKGSALSIVLFFSVFGLIAVSVYLYFQLSMSRPQLQSAPSFQALLNARSGAYKAFSELTSKKKTDTLHTISAMDSLFGKQLLGINVNDSLPAELTSSPSEMSIYSSDSFGTCEVSLTAEGGFRIINSIGKYLKFSRKVEAKIGNRIPALPDTVLIYYNKDGWEGREPDGVKIQKDSSNESISPFFQQLIDEYQSNLQLSDSSLPDLPLTIQSNKDFEKIPETVKGPLFIDGSYGDLKWKADTSIAIMGDLQITGKVHLENMKFICAGEVKILDQSNLVNVNIFSQSRVFVGDESRFQGNIIALRTISIYGKSEIIKGSSIISCGKSNESAKGALKDSSSLFSILLSENCVINAVCVALNTPGSVKTDPDVNIRGIIWAQNIVCHQGTMYGLISAKKVLDCGSPDFNQSKPAGNNSTNTSSPKNSIPGRLFPLPDISSYEMPFIIGTPSIIEWKEY